MIDYSKRLSNQRGFFILPGGIGAARPGGSPVFTWARRTTGAAEWSGISISDDGAKIAACIVNGTIRLSSDGGATWSVASAGTRAWRSIACSSDGVKLVAAGTGVTQYCHTSSDSGATWTQQVGSPAMQWQGLASSANGEKTRSDYQ